jgi:glycosyltransferase involved in cell wall biosynthesis
MIEAFRRTAVFVRHNGNNGGILQHQGDRGSDLAPAVSVVIPTRNRREFVWRAVRSALGQTFTNLEVVVVIDGPDEATKASLEAISDPRLRFHMCSVSSGGAQARNLGVQNAKADWIAFLDDDDQWLPEKLAIQMKIVGGRSYENLCVACRFLEQSETGERALPSRMPEINEPLSEYIYSPRGLSTGEGFVQTSTLLVRRSLMLKVPFLPILACGQETTWLLRSSHDYSLNLIIVPEVLVLFNDFQSRTRISIAPKWRTLYDWARENRAYYTPRAYSFFTATVCIQYATSCNEPLSTYVDLFRECLKGDPTPKCIFMFFYRWWVPRSTRHRVASLMSKVRNTAKGQPA